MATPLGSRPSPTRGTLARMRDAMAHRGPDGAGEWVSRSGHVRLAHRRLAVLDPSPAGAQPFMLERLGRVLGVLVYNGELYNDRDLRESLARAHGASFHTHCDTETLAVLLALEGARALSRLRGMYAFAWYDVERETLLLARDPLGMKPLYWWESPSASQREIAFASEIRPLLMHPGVSTQPDLVTVSSYLTTIRTTLGARTMYRDIRTLDPGDWIEFDLRDERLRERRGRTTVGDVVSLGVRDPSDVRAVLTESITRHLRSDVAMCSLLSGGLDSTILAAVSRRQMSDLWTYCSGVPATSESEQGDLEYAREAAGALHTRHTEAPVSRELFLERWKFLIDAARVPLSTPNEVAINEVARVLRSQGCVVTLSGEGADELFAGYEAPMNSAASFVSRQPGASPRECALFQLTDAAWAPLESKLALLNRGAWRAIEHDQALIEAYTESFAAVQAERDDEPLQAHLRFSRRVNLAGLLLRLDSATMRESVEGRTPFADAVVAALAESLPMREKFVPATSTEQAQTKIALRSAFSDMVPASILHRPKASFPLPFAEWIGAMTPTLHTSAFARELFTPAALHLVARQPNRLWRLAWPMINLAMWMP